MTNPKPKKRFYWIEGVTASEVEKSLNDRRPSRLRQQGPRRALVLLCAAVLLSLAAIPLMGASKLVTYLQFALLAGSIVGYLQLRKAVRHVSDAPDDMLDERQISLRNAGYLVAYRWIGFISMVLVTLVLVSIDSNILTPWLAPYASGSAWSNVVVAYMMALGCLPAMALAWNMPSEPTEDSP